MSVGYPFSPPPFDPDDPNGPPVVAPPPPLPPVPPAPAPAPSGISPAEEAELANLQPGQGATNGVPQPVPGAAGIAGVDVGKVAGKIAAAGQSPAPVAPPPVPAPAAAGAPPEVPAPSTGGTSDLQKAQEAEAKAREEYAKAQGEVQKAQQAGVEANQKIADQKVEDERAAQAERQRIAQQYAQADAAAQQQIQQTHDAIKNFKFRDYFSDGKGGTDWARKIGVSLATALGAFGAGLTRGPNYALQILNKDMDDAHAAQVDELGRMKDAEVTARTGLQDVQAARQKALADMTVADAARDRLVASQLEQSAARQKTAEFAPGLVAAAQKLRLDAAEKDTAAKKQLVELNVKLADEGRKAKLDEASIAEKGASTNLHNAQAAAGGFSPRHAKAGAGGGGMSSPAQTQAVETLSTMIAEKKPYAELVSFANANHVPLEGKAGHVSLKSLIAGVGSTGKLEAADTKIATHALDKLPSEFKTDLAENGVATGQGGSKGLLPTNRTLQKLRAAVESGNPLSVKEAFLAFDAAARGGAATQGSIDALTKTLGGSWDQFKNWMEGKATGGLSEDSRARFRSAIDEAIDSNVEAAQTAHDTMVGKYYAPDWYPLKSHIESQMGVFGGFKNKHGTPVFQVQRDTAAPGINRATGKAMAPGAAAQAQPNGTPAVDEAKVARAQAAQSSPTATPQQKANAAAWLKSVGR